MHEKTEIMQQLWSLFGDMQIDFKYPSALQGSAWQGREFCEQAASQLNVKELKPQKLVINLLPQWDREFLEWDE